MPLGTMDPVAAMMELIFHLYHLRALAPQIVRLTVADNGLTK
jgi:hypothetical protein